MLSPYPCDKMATSLAGVDIEHWPKKDLLTVLKDYVKQKEKRKSINSIHEDGFVLVMKDSVWTSLFGEYFMQLGDEKEISTGHEEDDMLFYVRCNLKTSYSEVVVFRKGSNRLPGLGDPHINWEETVYLNLIMHEMEYTVTCAVCSRLANRDLKVITKASVKIYASTNERRMDSKGEGSRQSYPNIFFMVDTFDQVFDCLCVQEGEMVCVELVATHKTTGSSAVIFLGSVGHDALKTVYDSKGSFGSKIVQKMTLGLLSHYEDHTEFIRMRGPHGKGFAQMAVQRYAPNGNEASENGNQQCRQCGRLQTTVNQIPSSHCSHCGSRTTRFPDSLGSFRWMRTRKKSSLTLSTQLTYVNLPWSRIMKDILEVRQAPVFTK